MSNSSLKRTNKSGAAFQSTLDLFTTIIPVKPSLSGPSTSYTPPKPPSHSTRPPTSQALMPFDDDEFEAALKGSSSNLNAQQGQAILLSSSSPLKDNLKGIASSSSKKQQLMSLAHLFSDEDSEDAFETPPPSKSKTSSLGPTSALTTKPKVQSLEKSSKNQSLTFVESDPKSSNSDVTSSPLRRRKLREYDLTPKLKKRTKNVLSSSKKEDSSLSRSNFKDPFAFPVGDRVSSPLKQHLARSPQRSKKGQQSILPSSEFRERIRRKYQIQERDRYDSSTKGNVIHIEDDENEFPLVNSNPLPPKRIINGVDNPVTTSALAASSDCASSPVRLSENLEPLKIPSLLKPTKKKQGPSKTRVQPLSPSLKILDRDILDKYETSLSYSKNRTLRVQDSDDDVQLTPPPPIPISALTASTGDISTRRQIEPSPPRFNQVASIHLTPPPPITAKPHQRSSLNMPDDEVELTPPIVSTTMVNRATLSPYEPHIPALSTTSIPFEIRSDHMDSFKQTKSSKRKSAAFKSMIQQRDAARKARRATTGTMIIKDSSSDDNSDTERVDRFLAPVNTLELATPKMTGTRGKISASTTKVKRVADAKKKGKTPLQLVPVSRRNQSTIHSFLTAKKNANKKTDDSAVIDLTEPEPAHQSRLDTERQPQDKYWKDRWMTHSVPARNQYQDASVEEHDLGLARMFDDEMEPEDFGYPMEDEVEFYNTNKEHAYIPDEIQDFDMDDKYLSSHDDNENDPNPWNNDPGNLANLDDQDRLARFANQFAPSMSSRKKKKATTETGTSSARKKKSYTDDSQEQETNSRPTKKKHNYWRGGWRGRGRGRGGFGRGSGRGGARPRPYQPH